MLRRSKFGRTVRRSVNPEITNYDEVQDYLANGTYPEGATKAVKGAIRKLARMFQFVDGVLHYKEILKTRQMRFR